MSTTGPKTEAGRAAVALNRVSHGLRAAAIVIPGRETQADWDEFRDAVIDDLEPVGAIEQALAERVAELFWRLRRATRAEQQHITEAIKSERVVREGREKANPQFKGTVYEDVFDPEHTPPADFIPAESMLRQILRYEASMSRQLYKALHELEARRDRREGKHTPVARVQFHGG